MLTIDKFIEFFYSNRISKDLIIFLLREQQQNSGMIGKTPAFNYLRKLIATVFNKNEDEKEMIFRTLFIISQLNSPRIMPAFSLRLLGQDDFVEEDIKIIRENVKMYINSLIKEENIV
ncbi:MAG: CerR family C-terminal domain-containing protein [Candidatus Gastranaerophilales bacterium]|nr:CerR family C-terminal domain-containing protein [Candidatus Gastranaerophilales bacterium]